MDIEHPHYIAVIDPDAAFWALVRKDEIGLFLGGGRLLESFLGKRDEFLKEMSALRFGVQPLAVYFNPTERCNLACPYCYIPEEHRRSGRAMGRERLLQALELLRSHFERALPEGVRPEVVFHGSEPLLEREAVFAGIDRHRDFFRFGVQTNGTLLDERAAEFLTSRGVSVGLSLDSALPTVANQTRFTWGGGGVYDQVIRALDRLRGYPHTSVICTVTRQNLRTLTRTVEFLHAREVPVCMLNPVRCTRDVARGLKPSDHDVSHHYFRALDRTQELYRATGRRIVVANFANILVSLLAPSARRLMCDLSPCGAGRCFFAVSARGDLFPCSEFLGFPEFSGGNLFAGGLERALQSPAFASVRDRKAEEIEPCRRCAVRHFCGAPCPAEAHGMRGSMAERGAFCELYSDQVRYALRLIADGKTEAYLWDGWDRDTRVMFNFEA